MKTKRQCKEMVWSKKKWCETKRNDVKQKEMMWNKKKWRETKRNDVKQKEMTRNKKKWREAIAHDVSPVAMFLKAPLMCPCVGVREKENQKSNEKIPKPLSSI